MGHAAHPANLHGRRSAGHSRPSALFARTGHHRHLHHAHLRRALEPQIRYRRLFQGRPGFRRPGPAQAPGARRPRERHAHHPGRGLQSLRRRFLGFPGRDGQGDRLTVPGLVRVGRSTHHPEPTQLPDLRRSRFLTQTEYRQPGSPPPPFGRGCLLAQGNRHGRVAPGRALEGAPGFLARIPPGGQIHPAGRLYRGRILARSALLAEWGYLRRGHELPLPGLHPGLLRARRDGRRGFRSFHAPFVGRIRPACAGAIESGGQSRYRAYSDAMRRELRPRRAGLSLPVDRCRRAHDLLRRRERHVRRERPGLPPLHGVGCNEMEPGHPG